MATTPIEIDASSSTTGEGTPLLSTTNNGVNSDTATIDSGSALDTSSDDEQKYDIDEIYGNWPQSFERSISILAGPKLDVNSVDQMTRSPRVVPIQVEHARGLMNRLNRGFLTPEPPKAGTRTMDSPDPEHFRKELKKHKSLDFKPRAGAAAPAPLSEKNLQKKLDEAHEYRMKVLQQATTSMTTKKKPKDVEEGSAGDHCHSPGYQRERIQQQRKADMGGAHGGHGDGGGSKGKRSTFAQSLFNMCNSLMGMGLLGLPFVFRKAGWVGGYLIFTVFAAMTWRTSVLIGRELNGDPRPTHFFDDSPFKTPTVPGSSLAARARKPIYSFPDIAREAFGNLGAVALASFLYFELFSCLAIFLVSLGDHMHALFPGLSTARHMVNIAIVLSIPTALLRTPTLLSYLSAVGTVATITVVIAVIISAVVFGDMCEMEEQLLGGLTVPDHGNYHTMWQSSGLPFAVGIVAYAFSGHALVPSIFSSMEEPQKFEKMIDATFVIVFTCSLGVAVSGYYMFGEFVQDQVTISLEQSTGGGGGGLAMTILTWLMILTAFSKFSLSMFPLALGVEELFAPYIHNQNTMDAFSVINKLVIIVLALLVGIYIPSFGFLCSLVGLICTMIVSVIFPAAAHLKLFGPQLSAGEKFIDYIFILCGTVSALVGTWATV